MFDLMFDFRTADNAPNPHVAVYVTATERIIAIFPIVNGDISEAESFAEILIEALNEHNLHTYDDERAKANED